LQVAALGKEEKKRSSEFEGRRTGKERGSNAVSCVAGEEGGGKLVLRRRRGKMLEQKIRVKC